MTIPTQFSVSKVLCAPITNPAFPQDPPVILRVEEASIIDGADLLASLASIPVGAPDALSSASARPIFRPTTHIVQPIADIDAPVAKTALDAIDIDAPTSKTARPSAPISTPLLRTALSEASIGTPIVKSVRAAITIPSPTARAARPEQDIDAPSSLASRASASVDTPTALTPAARTPTTPPFPLNHARILWDSVLTSFSSITESTSTGTGPRALIPNTFDRWSFTGNNWIRISLPTRTDIDTICIGGHNFAGAAVRVFYNIGAGEFEVDAVSPPDNAPLMFHLPNAVGVDSIRIQVTATGDRFAAFISAGIALQMQRPFFNGHAPITDGDVTNYYHNKTESGNIIGQAIRAQGYRTTYTWNNIDDGWYRQFFAPFKQAIKLQPFFIAWNLLEYPLDVGFGRVSQDITTPMQNGFGTKRSGLSFEFLGF